MGLDRNQLVILKDGQTERSLRSAVPVLLHDVIAQDRMTSVVADEVWVTADVRTKGYSLAIACRRLIFENNAAIDTSGATGNPSFVPGERPVTPPEDGREGTEGRDGGNGGDAGAVTIQALEVVGTARIVARGGAGGHGQDGGDGRRGAPGANGEDVTINVDAEIPSKCRGRNGRPGGAVGLPGRRGRGGDGGDVSLRAVAAVAGQPVIEVEGGAPGEPAQPGALGVGGEPGRGGHVRREKCREHIDKNRRALELVLGEGLEEKAARAALGRARDPRKLLAFVPGGDRTYTLERGYSANLREAALLATVPLIEICTIVKEERAGVGDPGSSGDAQLAKVEERQQVSPSMPGTITAAPLSLAELADALDNLTLDLIACDIEDEFRRAGGTATPGLRKRIEFLLEICVADPAPDKARLEVLARAYAMARNLALGLDFYGFSRERAPLLSFESYSRLIGEVVLPQAVIIENAFVAYWAAAEQKEVQRQQVVQARAAAEIGLARLESERAKLRVEAKKLLEVDLPALEKKVDAVFQLLMTREDELNQAIRNKNAGCDLVGTLTAAATIVTGVATGGAALIGTLSAGSKLLNDFAAHDDSLKQLWDNRKLIQKDLKELGSQASTVADSIGKVGEAISQLSPEQRRFPQFRMERARFDEIAREFTELPEAAEYKEAGYDYLKCTETRNQAIIDYNAMLAQLVEFLARIAAAERVIGGLQTVLNGLTDPSEPIVMGMMSRLYRDTLSLAARMVHSEGKALAYHFATPSDAPLSALNVAAITGAHQSLVLEKWVSAKERYEAKRDLAPDLLRLDLQRLVSRDAWDEFKRSGALSFTIRPDHPHYRPKLQGLPGLRLTGLSLRLPGAATAAEQDQIPWQLIHGGYETIYRADGSVIRFAHNPILFRGFTPTNGDHSLILPDFSEKNLYAGVSPYASWLLIISADPALQLNLSALTAAEIRLSGYIIEG